MSKKEDKALADLAKRVEAALDDGKAVDIRVLDVRKLTVITDYMIIASGRSSRQVRALAHRVMDTAKELGFKVVGIEGERESEWILVDLGGVVVHVMQAETRAFYQLEKLWEQRAPIELEAGTA